MDPNNMKAKPSALGVMNQIVLVTDNAVYKSIVGDTIETLFAGAYPLTPQPEELFDIKHYQVSDLNEESLRRELRTYLIVGNINDENSPVAKLIRDDLGNEKINRVRTDPSFRTSVGRDKWANGQLLIYVFGTTPEDLANAVAKNFEGIATKITEHDAPQLYQFTFGKGINGGLSKKLGERFGIQIEIPKDYEVAVDEPTNNGLIWLRTDTKDAVINIAIREYTYSDVALASKRVMIEQFDNFGKQYVSSEAPNSYMISNGIDLPILEFNRLIDGHYTKELRGVWELENDFMGGPFISYAIINEKLGKMLQIDGFIFAPGVKKRNMMQQLDVIVNQIKW
jgi:hypothetical protein